jgi:hypothetical protein
MRSRRDRFFWNPDIRARDRCSKTYLHKGHISTKDDFLLRQTIHLGKLGKKIIRQ